jgi:hypothetical protein
MITFTFAGDEAGDVSFNFKKGASRYFVVAMIATQEADLLRSALAGLRTQANLPETFDFHFNALASANLRRTVFDALGNLPFNAWALIVNKTGLAEPFKVMSGLELYLYFVTELIRQIPAEKRAGGVLILDEFGMPQHTRQELRRVLKARQIRHGFHKISLKRSQSEGLIQIADLVAGAVYRRDSRHDSQAFEQIQRKLEKVIEF